MPAEMFTTPFRFWGEGAALGKAIVGGVVSRTVTPIGPPDPANVSSYAVPCASAVKLWVAATVDDRVHEATREVLAAMAPRVVGFAPPTRVTPGGMFSVTVALARSRSPVFATVALTAKFWPEFTVEGADRVMPKVGGTRGTGGDTAASANGSSVTPDRDPTTNTFAISMDEASATCSTLSRREEESATRTCGDSSYSARSKLFRFHHVVGLAAPR